MRDENVDPLKELPTLDVMSVGSVKQTRDAKPTTTSFRLGSAPCRTRDTCHPAQSARYGCRVA